MPVKLMGPTSTRIAANLKRLRQQQGLGLRELSRRLAELGQPVADTGLIRTEQGDRAVTADEVVALAAVLGCSPNLLMLPGPMTPMTSLAHQELLTPKASESLGRMWAWATGEQPLEPGTGHDMAEFAMLNRPHRFQLSLAGPGMEFDAEMRSLIHRALTAGLSPWQLRTMLEQSMTAAINSDKVFDGPR
jgi:transcriptional regulator with XRE-family HTH domain